MVLVAKQTGVSRALRTLRERKDVSQVDLAKAAGLALTVVNRAEKGRSDPSVDSLLALLRALGVTLHELQDELDRQAGVFVRKRGLPRAEWVSTLLRHGIDAKTVGSLAAFITALPEDARADLVASVEAAAFEFARMAIDEVSQSESRLLAVAEPATNYGDTSGGASSESQPKRSPR